MKIPESVIGKRIKLKSYDTFSDYERHNGESATIIKVTSGELPYGIEWKNGDTSCVSVDNIQFIIWRDLI